MNSLSCFLFVLYLLEFGMAIIPPVNPPDEMLSLYTMNDTITMERFYIDDTDSGNSTHYKYLFKSMQNYFIGAERMYTKLSNWEENFQKPVKDAIGAFPKEQWLQIATFDYFSKHPIDKNDNLTAVVFGSTEPWLETWLIHLGFGLVVTSEYNQLTYEHPSIVTIPDGSENLLSFDQYRSFFDFAFSISSFDHSGLGRYGDQLDPIGDLKAMSTVLKVLKPSSGKIFLTVPIGPDLIVWNLLRRYGKKRLPLLLKGFQTIERYGWDQKKLSEPANSFKSYEPVLLLRVKPVEKEKTDTSHMEL